MRWQEVWDSAIVANKALVSDPTVQQLGFDFPRRTWSLLNRFRTTTSDNCQCGERQTMIHIVELCPRTKFADQGLILLHEADDNAVKWLETWRQRHSQSKYHRFAAESAGERILKIRQFGKVMGKNSVSCFLTLQRKAKCNKGPLPRRLYRPAFQHNLDLSPEWQILYAARGDVGGGGAI